MTSIVSNTYIPHYTNTGTSAETPSQQASTASTGHASTGHASTASASSSSATQVTLSEAAKAALADTQTRDSGTVRADARTNLDKILQDVKRTSPLEAGELAVDLSRFERRELFAIAADTGGQFPPDEKKAAELELQRRFDAELSGAYSIARATGSFEELYDAALKYLDAAPPEEKNTDAWKAREEAVQAALKQLVTTPYARPTALADDPVADYLERMAKGATSRERDIADLGRDARTVLDGIYQKSGDHRDFSAFGSRTLSAIALNTSEAFSSREVMTAQAEVKSRVSSSVQAAFRHAGNSTSPTAFSKQLIAQYSSMSAEEREVAGFNQEYYDAIMKNYETSLTIAQAFSGLSASGLSASGLSVPNQGGGLVSYL